MGTRSLDGWLQRLAKTLSGGREMWQRRWQGDTLNFSLTAGVTTF